VIYFELLTAAQLSTEVHIVVRSVCVFATALALVSFERGQNNGPPQPQPQPTVAANGGQITLDVQVTDRYGTPVRGLRKQDFTLLDGKRPQDIVSFQAVEGEAAGSPPTEIVLVVDAVNSSFTNVSYQREAIRQFLLQNGGRLAQPVSLIVFSDSGNKMQNQPSRDGKALAALYDEYETGWQHHSRSQGLYGEAERLTSSLSALQSFATYGATRPGRKLMIWFSPGWPLLSQSHIEISRRNEQQLFDSIVALSAELMQAHITLYDVDPRGVTNGDLTGFHLYEQFLKGVSSPSGVLPGNVSLQVLAIQSGGRVLNESNNLASEIAACGGDAQAYYIVSFNAHPADQPNEYHAISVKIDKPGVSARTRTGYYAQPH
jgi:VWFA-related protein